MLFKKFISLLFIVSLVFTITGCQGKSVTTQDLVDAYMETSADVDYSSEVKVNVEMLYHGEWEGIKDVVRTEYQESFDADTDITYQKGSSTMSYVYPDGTEEPTLIAVERYLVELEDGSKKAYSLDAETGEWMTTVSEAAETEQDAEVLYAAAVMSEEESVYRLMVACETGDVGFDVASFLFGEDAGMDVECGATLTALIDKKTMKCVSTSLEMDVADLNAALAGTDAGYEMLKLQIDVEGLEFEKVELEEP